MARSYGLTKVVNLKHLKKAATRSQAEIADLAGTVAAAIEEVLGVTAKGNLRIFHGECSTAASTQNKLVTISGIEALQAGDIFVILFTNNQTYNGIPKLNVNSLGAINIRRLSGTNAARYEWQAGQVVPLFYNGTYFIIMDGGIATTTYYGKTKLSSATDSTSEEMAATPKAVKAAYDLAASASAASDMFGLYLDENGYLCQRITSDDSE